MPIGRLRAYLGNRLRAPVTWLALCFIGVFLYTAIYGVSPFEGLSAIGFVFAAVEWSVIFLWWRRHRARKSSASHIAANGDRRKIAVTALFAAAILGADLWMGASGGSLLDAGVTVFGLSSLVLIWFAWSRPVFFTESGLVIGIQEVSWNEVRAVTWNPDGPSLIEFVRAAEYYGTSLSIMLPSSAIAELEKVIPATVARRSGTSS